MRACATLLHSAGDAFARGDPEEGNMQDTGAQAPAEALDEDDARLAHLGYRP